MEMAKRQKRKKYRRPASITPATGSNYNSNPPNLQREGQARAKKPESREFIMESLEDMLAKMGLYRNNPDYNDCLQEARLAVLEVGVKQQPAFCRQAAKWAVLNFTSRETAGRGKTIINPIVSGNAVEDEVVDTLMREEEFRGFVQMLTPAGMFAYVLTVCSPLTQQQIADMLGVSAREVRRLIVRAREQMAAMDAADLNRRKGAAASPSIESE